MRQSPTRNQTHDPPSQFLHIRMADNRPVAQPGTQMVPRCHRGVLENPLPGQQQNPACLGSTDRPFMMGGHDNKKHASREAVHTTLGQRAQGLAGLLVQGGGSIPPPWAVPASCNVPPETGRQQDTPKQLEFRGLGCLPARQPAASAHDGRSQCQHHFGRLRIAHVATCCCWWWWCRRC